MTNPNLDLENANLRRTLKEQAAEIEALKRKLEQETKKEASFAAMYLKAAKLDQRLTSPNPPPRSPISN